MRAFKRVWQRKGLPALVWLHRWLGIATCLIFALWFASGAVMVFEPFPALPRSDQLGLQAPVAVDQIAVAPVSALERIGAQADGLRIVERAGRPAYIVQTPSGGRAIDAISGASLPLLSDEQARKEALRLFGAGASVHGPFDYDQWVVHNRFDTYRPLYRLDANDPAGTQLYLSARTGELVQRTTRSERMWNWAGAVLHWVYFTPLRSDWTMWDQSVWWLSLICMIVAMAGIVLGLVRMAAARRLRTPKFSFYRERWLRWHHLLGLVTSMFVLGWIFSGWLSMDHGRLFSRGTATEAQVARYAGCPLNEALQGIGANMIRSDSASEIEFTSLSCRPLVINYGPAGAVFQTDGHGQPLSGTNMKHFITMAVRRAWPQAQKVGITPVDPASIYARAEGWPTTALRVRLGSSTLPDLYVDGQTGRLLTVLNNSRAAYAWVYYGLHTFNFPGLITRPALRRFLLILPLTAGFMFSLTGVIIGWRRLLRTAQRR
ncbi:PepSY domain-containing protein [Stakelama pacifica]|uniref:PepSY-associated transmembrane protein n=1 Tax=Stakelama pacifica TaxID=517720 RepID=A0A4V3BUE7_9SPHN|nr:PepSY domain-containing protein [Stakelama pacifica]TDN86988.1 PepSY-associated transmembrane protein [Stakelama pacifica]GGO91266.1 hypothetical protein GCM10011329_05600 [Stakelama pacifica]